MSRIISTYMFCPFFFISSTQKEASKEISSSTPLVIGQVVRLLRPKTIRWSTQIA